MLLYDLRTANDLSRSLAVCMCLRTESNKNGRGVGGFLTELLNAHILRSVDSFRKTQYLAPMTEPQFFREYSFYDSWNCDAVTDATQSQDGIVSRTSVASEAHSVLHSVTTAVTIYRIFGLKEWEVERTNGLNSINNT